MLIEEEYKNCASSLHIKKTWYKMISDVFVAFLYRVRFLLSYSFPIVKVHVMHYTHANPYLPLSARDS